MHPGRPPLLTFNLSFRSRYSETDKMGVVYHSRYLEYFEVIRTEFIRQAGITYKEMEDSGVMLPVSHVDISYHQPVYYDELMDGKLLIFDEPGVRLITYYDISVPGEKKPRVTGKVTLVFVDSQTRRPVRAPAVFMKKMNEYAQLA